MPTRIAPMLAVSDPVAAIAFYTRAFNAVELWRIAPHGMVAGMSIDGADFFLAHESPPNGTHSPAGAGYTTVRIELFVDDPHAVHATAIAAGAREHSPVAEHEHQLEGGDTLRMLQGSIIDPFGHVWLIGKFLD